jgi:uncharacterized paraquat-inducible protein A
MMKVHKMAWVAIGAALVISVALVAQAGEFVGDAKCKMCHKTQHKSWAETTHAKATEHAKAATDREYSADCLKCHATNADEKLAGVQCEACHGAGSDYKKMSIMKDREKAIANGLVIPSQETCDGCHTGDDHSSKKVFDDEKTNKAAVHEFKAKE